MKKNIIALIIISCVINYKTTAADKACQGLFINSTCQLSDASAVKGLCRSSFFGGPLTCTDPKVAACEKRNSGESCGYSMQQGDNYTTFRNGRCTAAGINKELICIQALAESNTVCIQGRCRTTPVFGGGAKR